ncbi:MAG: hypothetical protein LBH98_09705 [Chitinispirillales bacterium]|jgi:hypothetical protein|nr:hypothetical protein [Chitinispirillales bacterium]
MLDFTKAAFRKLVEISLWINLIVYVVAGGVIGWNGGHDVGIGRELAALLCVIIGALVGMLTNILFGGFIATIIAIEENTKLK